MDPVYVDNHLLVAVKPPGILSQADETGDADMLTLWKSWLKERYEKPGRVFLGLVHRLDRPASGLMVFARTSKAASRLARIFKEREVEKEYVAAVEGLPPHPGMLEDYLIKEDRRVRVCPPDHPGALHAALDLYVCAIADGFSLVGIRLKTGRPHQIRVQLSARGSPIIGDFKYGASSELDGRNLALHAWRLAFEHPVRRVPLEFEAPLPTNWPQKYRELWTVERRPGRG
jgi:RluA family pseudouridine synthase